MTDDLILDHFYKGRWLTKDAYDALRGPVSELLQPGEGDPAKIKADRDAGIIPAETLKLMEGE